MYQSKSYTVPHWVAEHELFTIAVFMKKSWPAWTLRSRSHHQKGVAGRSKATMMLRRAAQRRPEKNKEREAAKRLVLRGNCGAKCVVGASARSPRGTPGQLPPLSTKGGSNGHQSFSSGTAIAHVGAL